MERVFPSVPGREKSGAISLRFSIIAYWFFLVNEDSNALQNSLGLGYNVLDCETEFLLQRFQRCGGSESFHTDAAPGQSDVARPAQCRSLFYGHAGGD